MSFEMRSFSINDVDLPVSCGLCEGLRNIKWRCIECNTKMCDKCKIIHSNTRGNKGHRIISFSDLDCCMLDSQIKARIQKLPCPKHPYQNYTLYCKTCNYLVCNTCVPHNHVLHDISGLDLFIDEKLKLDGQEVSDNLPKRFLARSPSQNDYYTSIDFQLIHKVTTNIPVVYYLKTVSYLSAWIGCREINEIHKVKIPIKSRKFCLKFIYNKMNKDIPCNQLDQIDGFEAIDIVLIDKEDILFVSKLDHHLKRAFTDAYGQKQICNIENFDPLDPICLHIEQATEHIWIGLKERGKDEISPMSIRKVIAISKSWKTENTFEFTTTGKRHFTLPFRIADIAGQICVIDRIRTTAGRVVSLNRLGHRNWQYSNAQETGTSVKPFLPTAIATTHSQILVLDAANSTIHVLNTSGNIIAFQSLTDLEIDRPFSLDIDPSGQLWVGTACDKNSEEQNANLCVIKMTIQ